MPSSIQQALLMASAAGSGPSDPSFSNVVLLMGFEGVNGAISGPGFIDESPSAHGAAVVGGAAVISTAQFEFGSSSVNVNGAGGLFFADSNDWLLSSANSDQFTVECSVRLTNLTGTGILVCQYSVDGTFSWSLQANTGTVQFSFSPNGTFASGTYLNDTGALSANTWYQIAADKDASGKVRLYRNGVMVASTTPANSAFFNSAQRLGIGWTDGQNGPLPGFLDELRITKGLARYASDSGYTVPTAPFPRHA